MSSRLFHKNVFWLTILMIVGIVVPSAFAQGGKRVLYINSYNMSFPASVDQYRGLQSVLDTTGMMVYAEFMNSKRFPGADNIESFYKRLEFLVKKSLPYDAIIVSDDAAFRFVIENQNKLFYHIPIFFFGVNDIQFGLAQNSNPWVVGLLEKASLQRTLNLMIQLFPKRKKIYIVCDHTLSCVNEYNELKRLFPKYRDIKFETLWSDNYTAPEFAKKLSSLDKDSPLLYEAAYTNKKELSIRTLDEGVKFVNTYFHGPVFSASSYGVKAGALGGEVISFYQHGRVIGRMVKRVLEGADISKMKVMPVPPYEYMFNYNTMKKFGISECQLPSGSVILNKPKSIYEQHKDVVITTIVFISLLLVMIVFLVRLLLQRVKTSKELVIAKDRAEQSDRLKSDFIRNMSHEVKTPLNSIVGFTDLLASGCEKNAENNSYIAIIHDNVKQLIGIIRKVLEIASIESRAEELVMSEISLTDILNDQYHNNVDAACAKGLELIFDHTNDASDCVILSDGKKLSKMLSYLLENAIKFTSKGDIHIGFRHEKNAKRVLIYVKDTGIGISADQQKIIFGRFMQTEDPLSRKFGGMGLGLAIARENAHLLGGDISVESEIGEGATFFVSLPC